MMDAKQLKKILEDHVAWLRGGEGHRANLQRANLQGADLQRADLDFSCWPLWCGSLAPKIDRRLAAQLAYHFLAVWPEARTPKLLALANEFHRVECPRLTKSS